MPHLWSLRAGLVATILVFTPVMFSCRAPSSPPKTAKDVFEPAAKIVVPPTAARRAKPKKQRASTADRWVSRYGHPLKRGARERVALVEITDLRSKHAARLHPSLLRLEREFGSAVSRTTIVTAADIRPGSMPAARAVIAAHMQGRFWPMYERILLQDQSLKKEDFLRLAGQLELDEALFERNLRDPRALRYLKDNKRRAFALHADSVPTLFVNGRMLQGVLSYDVLRGEVQAAINASGESLVAGVAVRDIVRHQSRKNNPAFARIFLDRAPVPDGAGAGSSARGPHNETPQLVTKSGRRAGGTPVWSTRQRISVVGGWPSRGPEGATVELVLFSDLISRGSARYLSNLRALVDKMNGKARLVVKPFPVFGGAVELRAADLAWEAQSAGRFWPLVSAIAGHWSQDATPINEEFLGALRTKVGLAPRRSDTLPVERIRARQKTDAQEAVSARVRSAPALFVNGHQYLGQDRSVNGIEGAIRERFFRAKRP